MFCPNCGNQVDGGLFCGYCGTRLPEAAPVADNQPVAAPVAEPIVEPAPVVEAAPVAEPVAIVEPVAEQVAIVEPVAEPAPVTVPVPVAAPVTEAAPVAEPVSVVEPVAEPAPAVESAPAAQTPAPAVASKPKKKKSAKPFIIIGAIVLGVVILIGGGIGAFFFILSSKYNQGLEAIDDGNYEEALETFTALNTYKDSEYWAEYAQKELDYQTIDELVAAKDYDAVIEILSDREDFFGKDAKGKDAKALLEEYEIVKAAFEDKDAGRYQDAAEKFDSLVLLHDQYRYDGLICQAYAHEANDDWMEALVILYGIQIDDLELAYLDNPQDSEQQFVSDTYYLYGDFVEDPQAVEDVMKPEGEEETELTDYAVKGLWYIYANDLWTEFSFEEAIEIFENLGDFKDSASMAAMVQSDLDYYTGLYAEAETYYNNGEYYKALEIFDSMPRFRDSSDRAASCYQPLPETGDYRYDDGSIDLTIYAPDSSLSLFIRVYDSDGNVVAQSFIRPGDYVTLWLWAGTYTIKVAYGTEWFGEIDLFGEDGTYSQLYNGYDPEFTFRSGYYYELELQVGSGGNVGTGSLGGADDM